MLRRRYGRAKEKPLTPMMREALKHFHPRALLANFGRRPSYDSYGVMTITTAKALERRGLVEFVEAKVPEGNRLVSTQDREAGTWSGYQTFTLTPAGVTARDRVIQEDDPSRTPGSV